MEPERVEEPALPKDTSEDQEQEIELAIKNPYRQKRSFSCNVSVHDTLLDLKEHLQAVYFGNPKPAEQRLIFAGKIYEDSTKLSEIFSRDGCDDDEPRICHLIVSSQLSSAYTMENNQDESPTEDSAAMNVNTNANTIAPQVTERPPIAIERLSPTDRPDETISSNNVHTHRDSHSHVMNSSNQGATSFQQQQQMYLHNLYQQQVLLQRQFLNAMGSNNNALGEQTTTTTGANINIGSTEGLSQAYQFPNPSAGVESYLGNNFMDTATLPSMLGSSFGGLSPAAFAVEMRGATDPVTSVRAPQPGCDHGMVSTGERRPIESNKGTAKDEDQSKKGEMANANANENSTAESQPVDPLERLEHAYEKLIRTMVLSQQLQALSNPILFTPQPMLSYHDYLRNYQYQRRGDYVQQTGLHQRVNNNDFQSPNNSVQQTPVTEDTQDPARNNRNNLDAAAAENLRPVNVVVQRVFAINIGLIMKLAFFVYIVAGDASYSRLMWVVATAFLYYIYEVGFFAYMFGRELSFTSLLDSLGQSRLVQIPPPDMYPGYATDIAVIVKTFLFSLVPSWHPVRYPEEMTNEQQQPN
mmetsp:Transcript_17598/g.21664  ORF Transcript_17598/g.21664 Transcript_17598/m.21664 type:complete len:583 (+) Transcript_17598:354-2102(+)|eukprot:CAMPEP_0204854506 /NCGR_PEP_ID=MMETSP1347-20130617/15209_1 /ASSEMBLY_ACC=CAM_ASM_000690 /TAXON_ID=215587 /ORGANISM="Aplanochytrium stocchinoi, Strain GSBS06" /LENGTH=582 /DNA_ID=CAMNT_0052000093 /DNA_START=233 /DNA_END=1981 /DNA_ORIENTATION=+